MSKDNPSMRQKGRRALKIALLGSSLPIAIFLLLQIRMGEDIGWQVGLGLFVLAVCLTVLIVCQVIALRLARQARKTLAGKWAAGIAACFLLLAGLLILLIVWEL